MEDSAQTLTPDALVADKYRIKRLIAEGGMGAIYHAEQEPLGRDVALKILKPQEETPQKRQQREKRFFKEAAVSAKLTHPNTIVILDYGTLPDDAGFFLVMEYLEGRSLRELLIERGSLGTRVTLHIAMQMASSLADAHKNGAVHRDLKPPNVMLVPRGEDPYFVKVVDFGLVKELEPDEDAEELTLENHLVGSPMYMAPERFLSHDADSPAVDVYSIGIMMYEMLVGRPPFMREGDSTLQHIMMQHIQDDPPSMFEFRPDLELPDGVENMVMQCLAKHPEDRIQSMEALLTLLKTCAAGAGMAVADVVEDTGAFTPPAGLTRKSGPQPSRASGPQSAMDTEEGAAKSDTTRKLALIGGLAGLLVVVLVGFIMLSGSTTHLVVNSTPSGAVVFLGDESLGSTPYDAPLELEAPATIRVQKDGFEPFEYRVLPAPGAQVLVDAKLTAVVEAAGGDDGVTAPSEPVKRDPVEPAEAPVDDGGSEDGVAAPTKPKKPKKKSPDIKLTR